MYLDIIKLLNVDFLPKYTATEALKKNHRVTISVFGKCIRYGYTYHNICVKSV